jgi:hypothetical protein
MHVTCDMLSLGLNQAVLCADPHAQPGSARSTNIVSNFISAWQHSMYSICRFSVCLVSVDPPMFSKPEH